MDFNTPLNSPSGHTAPVRTFTDPTTSTATTSTPAPVAFIPTGSRGTLAAAEMAREFLNTISTITTPAEISRMRAFEEFCNIRDYTVDKNTTPAQLNVILTDYAYSMRKKDGTNYKHTTVKNYWNITAEALQSRFYYEYGIVINPFKGAIFAEARKARDAKRKVSQKDSTQRPLTIEQLSRLVASMSPPPHHGVAANAAVPPSVVVASDAPSGSTTEPTPGPSSRLTSQELRSYRRHSVAPEQGRPQRRSKRRRSSGDAVNESRSQPPRRVGVENWRLPRQDPAMNIHIETISYVNISYA